mgnify:CR=1 FL=1
MLNEFNKFFVALLCFHSIINSPTIFTFSYFLHLTLLFLFSMKSTAYLTLIMTVNWIFEIISFYNETSSTFFDIINALQGVFIFFIFVCLPRPRNFLKYWWKDRGSFQIVPLEKPSSNNNEIQMRILKQ